MDVFGIPITSENVFFSFVVLLILLIAISKLGKVVW